MNNEIKEIREYISCPQFGDNHYGKWGALRLDQRIKIKDLLDYINTLQQENIKLISENEAIKSIKYTVDEVIYKSRINKAIELIEPFVEWGECTINGKILKKILDILKGDDENEK